MSQEDKFKKENEKLNLTNDKIKSKLVNYQELFDSNQRMITVGNKLNDISERYFNNGKNISDEWRANNENKF